MTLEHPPVPGKIPGEFPRKPVSRRGFLKIAVGVGAAAGLAAAGGIVVPMLSSDGESPSSNPNTQPLAGGEGAPTPNTDPTVTPDTDPTVSPTATPEATKTPEIIPPHGELRIAAERAGIEVGTNIRVNELTSEKTSLYTSEFNFLQISAPWNITESQKGNVNFQNAQRALDIALKSKMQTGGNVGGIIYKNDYPSWLTNGNLSRDESIQILRDRVNSVISTFKGKIDRWSVVNEYPFYGNYSNGDDVLRRVIGEDMIDIAYTTAREANPSAQLIYNDLNNETTDSSNYGRTKATLDRLKTKDLIDGIGIQMHVDGSKPPSREKIIQTFQNYGLPVYVTEMDVNMKDVVGSDEDKLAKQADIYKSLVGAVLDSGSCKNISFFDSGDKYSWLERKETKGFSLNAKPTLYDDNLKPKPAYYAVLDVLKSLPPKTS